MIFYFTGTGNSKYAASAIAAAQNDTLIPIAKELDKNTPELIYECAENELIGFVYPVYAWAPPQIVLDFIARLQLKGGKPYLFSLSTCGDEEGNATKQLEKALKRKNLSLDSAFTLRMPNNYIVGFDVDDKETERQKLAAAEKRMVEINRILTSRQTGVMELIPGKGASIKSALIAPMFNRFGRSAKSFFATDDCTSCGLCERICPVHTIKVNGKPSWGKECTQCLACLHRCPVRAVQYGKGTLRKGRYHHPDIA